MWGLEPGAATGGEWTGPVAHLRVPAPDGAGSPTVSLLLSADGPRQISLGAGGEMVEHTASADPTWFEVTAAGPAVGIVNNVGVELVQGGFAADRGYFEPDDGRFDEAADVFAWCGAGVLLRRSYLDDVGLFAEDLFVYYEDIDLAWRGASRGWRYRTVPDSVVHHVHSATSGRSSPLKQYYDERNRLLVLARHGGAAVAASAAARSLLVTASYARRDVVSPLLRRHPPRPELVARRLRAWTAALGALPAALRGRPADGT
jgi:hypothetical protein